MCFLSLVEFCICRKNNAKITLLIVLLFLAFLEIINKIIKNQQCYTEMTQKFNI